MNAHNVIPFPVKARPRPGTVTTVDLKDVVTRLEQWVLACLRRNITDPATISITAPLGLKRAFPGYKVLEALVTEIGRNANVTATRIIRRRPTGEPGPARRRISRPDGDLAGGVAPG
ncbi:hypothetical protein ACEUZ9_002773 [Paracoccus litorisediminis]|uniref:hypothetical protein n=1 Tax=Paracoccus litorisediminis TaxID=2006130 RepID=UPI0037322AA9